MITYTTPKGKRCRDDRLHENKYRKEVMEREGLLTEIAQGEEVYKNVERFLPLIQKYTDITELNAHILNELIVKIVVHEKQVGKDGVKSQEVDIYYKFIGYINLREWLENGVWCEQKTPDGQRPVLVKPA